MQSKGLNYMKINNATNNQTNQSKKYVYYETWVGKNENKQINIFEIKNADTEIKN